MAGEDAPGRGGPSRGEEAPVEAIRSLVWSTDIDVLPIDRLVSRSPGYWTVRSPSNPGHWWGNFLLFDAPPEPGDGVRWEGLFATAFAPEPQVRHRAFAWDDPQGRLGCADTEFLARGYQVEHTVALAARPDELVAHPRENREVVVRTVDPAPGGDEEIWAQILELHVAHRDPWVDEASHREFARGRLTDLRRLFLAGRGGWFVAVLGEDRHGQGARVVGSCGIVVTGPRGRYQTVDTAEPYRRRGISSRLVVEAARRTAADYPVKRLVICADPAYHALGIYESLGFVCVERAAGLLRPPPPTTWPRP